MKKIFCILCHRVTNPLIYTVKYLSSFNENVVIIHVDLKSKIEEFSILRADNVFFVKNRVNVTWGSYTQILSTLNSFKDALKFQFEYLFLLSGDDLPCKTNQGMNDLLTDIGMKNLIHFQDERNKYINPVSRVMYSYPDFFYKRKKRIYDKLRMISFKAVKFFFITKSFKTHSRKIERFYKGTNWLSLNKKTVLSLMTFIDSNDWYCDLYRNSYCADEVFFHTAIKHLGINDNFHDASKLNDALRYIDWISGPEYPKVLGYDDLAKIKISDCFFSRKIATNVSRDFFEDLIG